MPSVVKKKQNPRHTDVFVLHMTTETLTKGVIPCLPHLQVKDPQHNLVGGGENRISHRRKNKTRTKNLKGFLWLEFGAVICPQASTLKSM